MNGREPHHYCGFLILLLAMLSVIAWAYFPPPRTDNYTSLVISSELESPAINRPPLNDDNTAYGLPKESKETGNQK
jgi:hypothetical protein